MAPASCTQCQRRKQRCSRDWPCSNCRARDVSHLCKFVEKRLQTDDPEYIDVSTFKKSKQCIARDHGIVGSSDKRRDPHQASADLFLHPILTDCDALEVSDLLPLQNEVATAVLNTPPRYLCDALVNNFVHNVNFIHYSIYPPRFIDEYTAWWNTSTKLRSPAFTCLLLRVCAYSAQYLPKTLRSLLETNLGEHISESSQRFHSAAQKLSIYIKAGSGGLTHVQQLFLAVPWFKSECYFTETWHALAAAIREAQEIYLYNENKWSVMTDLDRELRRRMWCLLCVCDFQISSWLGRPLLIDHGTYAVKVPSSDLDADQSQHSPFMINILQYRLCLMLHRDRGLLLDEQDEVYRVLGQIDTWMNRMPPAFAIDQPRALSVKLPMWTRQQRLQLHAIATKSKLDVLRRFLFKGKPRAEKEKSGLKDQTIETGLRATSVARQLFEVMTVANAKAYLVSCIGFEGGVTLAATMIHGLMGKTSDRQRCIDAISDMLDMLLELRDKTRLGMITYGILRVLVQSIPLHDLDLQSNAFCMHLNGTETQNGEATALPDFAKHERSINGRPSKSSYQSDDGGKSDLASLPADACFAPEELTAQQIPWMPTVLDFEATNFDGLEEVWDWQDLDLTAYEDTSDDVRFRPR